MRCARSDETMPTLGARSLGALAAAAASILLATAASAGATQSATRLAFHPENGGIELPAGFRAVIVADDLGDLRFMAVAPNGDLYLKTRSGGLYALRDTNGDGQADVKETFGGGGGTGIAVRDGYLYHSTDSAVLRYKLTSGKLVPGGEPQTVVSGLPDERQHSAKSFAFDDQGRLYVEVGSPSNAYGKPDRARGAVGQDPTEFLKTHGGFWRFDPNRLNQTQADGFHYSTGHRHVLAVAWSSVSDAFFVVMHGRDQLHTVYPEHYTVDDNAELPAEEMHVLREGSNLGWPFTYYDPIKNARMMAPEYGGDNAKRAETGRYPDPLVAFPAHWAPMQMAFYDKAAFPEKYRGGAFVAFHGSWNRAPKPQKGYKVAFVPFDEKGMPRGSYEVFADGFAGAPEIASPRDARFRPCGLAVGPDGSLYVADSQKGRVWRIVYAPDAARGNDAAEAQNARSPSGHAGDAEEGRALYATHCATCHMADGAGVPGMQAALTDSAIVSGDAGPLIRLLLEGPDAVLPPDRSGHVGAMPPFTHLSDSEIASLVTYVRGAFGERASSSVAPDQVAALRSADSGGR